ncbi:MAG TPA: SipW-dependent-type signal peptide-containing protein [Anaerolineaceae bacterium]|nr:SipW-dependent-type signal peptide-containing protein [Anaerolineaceae bacterium]
MKKYMVIAVFAMIAIMALGMLNTGAWFTDSVTSAPNTLHSGTLSLDDGRMSTISLGTIENVYPGWESGPVKIEIYNDGTLDLAWFGNLIVSGNDVMKDAIYIKQAKMEFNGGAWTEPDDLFIENGLGAGQYDDCYDTLGLLTLRTFDNHTCNIPQTGHEFYGALRPHFSYTLTLWFAMDKSAGNNAQDKSIDISLKVDAMQANQEAIEHYNPVLGLHYNGFVVGTLAAQKDN